MARAVCVPHVHLWYTFLPLRTSSGHLAELGQIFSSDTQDTSIPHSWQLSTLDPILDCPCGDFQQFGNFLGRIHPTDLRRFWHDRRFFLSWHTQQRPFKVVSLDRTSINLTENFCTHRRPLNIL